LGSALFENNSGIVIRLIFGFFEEAYQTGVLPEDVADVFAIRILKAYNADGSDRMIIERAA
jgi:hypothetical protein